MIKITLMRLHIVKNRTAKAKFLVYDWYNPVSDDITARIVSFFALDYEKLLLHINSKLCKRLTQAPAGLFNEFTATF